MNSAPANRDEDVRRAAAAAGRQCLAGQLSLRGFMARFNDSIDSDIWALGDLLEHEPSRLGFLGVSDAVFTDYRAQIIEVIERLETS